MSVAEMYCASVRNPSYMLKTEDGRRRRSPVGGLCGLDPARGDLETICERLSRLLLQVRTHLAPPNQTPSIQTPPLRSSAADRRARWLHPPVCPGTKIQTNTWINLRSDLYPRLNINERFVTSFRFNHTDFAQHINLAKKK